MARIYANNVTSNSMRINVTELTYPAKDYGGFEIVLVKSSTQEYVYWNNWTSTNSTYNTWHDIYNSMPSPPLYQKLTPNTEYKVSVSGKWNGTWYLIDTIYVTTARSKLSTPYYVSSSISSNSITINYSNVSNANVYDIQCTNGITASPYSPSDTFNNLQPNTQYGFRCRARDYNYNYEVSDWSGYTYLTTSKSRPTNWSWNTAERNAFNNHGAVTTLTWDRWNSFVDKIVEFRNYKGLTEYVTVGGTSYHITNAKVSSSDKTLTALKFNIARTAIGNMNSTGITDRVKGDIVYGSYFITLEDKLKGIT